MASVRPRVDAELIDTVVATLTERDRVICEHLLEHRVLTTAQLRELAFDSLTRAETRLVALYRRRVVDRFRPYTATGSAPYHYLLDEVGAAALAGVRGQRADELPWRRDQVLRWARSQRLAHLIGTNGVFTALVDYARHHPGYHLAAWWSERRCVAAFGSLARPDGYGQWRYPGGGLDFCLEYDTGTETVGRVASKMTSYAKLQLAVDRSLWVLIWTSTSRREGELRRALLPYAHAVRVATATDGTSETSAGNSWLALRGGHRVALAEISTQNEENLKAR